MARRRLRFWTVLLLAFVIPVVASTTHQAPTRTASSAARPFDGFDEAVTGIMREWKVPGLAVGAIRDGQVVLAKGYGFRDVARQLPMTPQTLMAIGSNSKSFTVTLMGMLSDENKLDWDKPVRSYLPDFELHDDVATRLMTPTDLVTHRSGLPRHDGMWFGRTFTRKDLYHRLRFLEPSATFRQRYQYNNLMYLTAGLLVEQVGGRSWEDAIRQRILTPLGMNRSTLSVRDMSASGDAALAYIEQDGQVAPVPYRVLDNIAPAGAINSNVDEMLHYIQMQIDQGTYKGQTIISKRFAMRMQSPQMAIPPSLELDAPKYLELGPGGYGLGVTVTGYRGHTLVGHGGGIDGFISSMSWMPDDRFGVIVLTNLSGTNPVPTIVMRHVYDRLLGLDRPDWVARAKSDQVRARERQQARDKQRASERVAGTSPSHRLEDYPGAYEHPGYGTIRVRHDGGKLGLVLDQLEVTLEHFHYDVFRAVKAGGGPNPLDRMRVTFSYSGSGSVDTLSIPLEASVAPIVFKRTSTTTTSSGNP